MSGRLESGRLESGRLESGRLDSGGEPLYEWYTAPAMVINKQVYRVCVWIRCQLDRGLK